MGSRERKGRGRALWARHNIVDEDFIIGTNSNGSEASSSPIRDLHVIGTPSNTLNDDQRSKIDFAETDISQIKEPIPYDKSVPENKHQASNKIKESIPPEGLNIRNGMHRHRDEAPKPSESDPATSLEPESSGAYPKDPNRKLKMHLDENNINSGETDSSTNLVLDSKDIDKKIKSICDLYDKTLTSTFTFDGDDNINPRTYSFRFGNSSIPYQGSLGADGQMKIRTIGDIQITAEDPVSGPPKTKMDFYSEFIAKKDKSKEDPPPVYRTRGPGTVLWPMSAFQPGLDLHFYGKSPHFPEDEQMSKQVKHLGLPVQYVPEITRLKPLSPDQREKILRTKNHKEPSRSMEILRHSNLHSPNHDEYRNKSWIIHGTQPQTERKEQKERRSLKNLDVLEEEDERNFRDGKGFQNGSSSETPRSGFGSNRQGESQESFKITRKPRGQTYRKKRN